MYFLNRPKPAKAVNAPAFKKSSRLFYVQHQSPRLQDYTHSELIITRAQAVRPARVKV